MIKHIDVFLPPLNRYGVLSYFTVCLHKALLRAGIKSRLLEAKRNDPEPFLKALFEDRPDCTLSFNGLLPDISGRFFSDMVNIPHVGFIVDSVLSFTCLVSSKQSIAVFADEAAVAFFQGLGFNRSLFLPIGVDRELGAENSRSREYDVVMLGSCIDYEAIRKGWNGKYSPQLIQVFEQTVEEALSNPSLPYYQVFVNRLNSAMGSMGDFDPTRLNYLEVLDDIGLYMQGKDRVELVRAVKDAKVDLFGGAEDGAGWSHYVGDKKNVVIHEPVPFEQALSIMKHSKIVLNSTLPIYRGMDERLLSGMACGALVITSDNSYVREQFTDGRSIVLYGHGQWDKLNRHVNEYLEGASQREKIVAEGRGIVMSNHTWDHRVAKLLKQLPKYLESIS